MGRTFPFEKSNINDCNLPQMKIVENLYTMGLLGLQGMNIICCILNKRNYVFYLLTDLELMGG